MPRASCRLPDVAHERDVGVVDGDGQLDLVVERGRRHSVAAAVARRFRSDRSTLGRMAPAVTASTASHNRADMRQLLFTSRLSTSAWLADRAPLLFERSRSEFLQGELNPGRPAVCRSKSAAVAGRNRRRPRVCGLNRNQVHRL